MAICCEFWAKLNAANLRQLHNLISDEIKLYCNSKIDLKESNCMYLVPETWVYPFMMPKQIAALMEQENTFFFQKEFALWLVRVHSYDINKISCQIVTNNYNGKDKLFTEPLYAVKTNKNINDIKVEVCNTYQDLFRAYKECNTKIKTYHTLAIIAHKVYVVDTKRFEYRLLTDERSMKKAFEGKYLKIFDLQELKAFIQSKVKHSELNFKTENYLLAFSNNIKEKHDQAI